jgi:hypothetical protein
LKVGPVLRLLVFLLGMVTTVRPRPQAATWRWPADPAGAQSPAALRTDPREPTEVLDPAPPWPGAGASDPRDPGGAGRNPGPRRRRVPRWVKLTAILALIALIFRKAIASVVLMALSGALHLVGINVHLPTVKFGWPWQAIHAGTATTTNTDLGPWVLQKIEGISRPALGQANFSFVFTHKVSKSIGPWPCWYSSTFYAVGHASATVDLNPGPAWWAPASGHYRLQVLSRPQGGKPGHVTVVMVLPRPQLPQSAHQVTIDNLPSRPIDTQHSWTYPGFGCGALVRPQFQPSVLYAQAQQIAFYKANHAPMVTGALVNSAEAEATQTIRDNFVQPTVNAFGYLLDGFTIRWAAAP